MYDVLPGWYTTVYPIYYVSGYLLSILAMILFIGLIGIKIFKIEQNQYRNPLNIGNLAFCILGTVLLAIYLFELTVAWYSGYINEQYSFFNRAIGPYWISYVLLMWLPLLITQLFWSKKNRLNINLSLLIVVLFNLHMWIERIVIVVTSLMRE